MRYILLIVFICITQLVFAQKQTATVKVWGNCSMCKSRIEMAARLPGVMYAAWDSATDMLTVTYKMQKVSLAQIQAQIATQGYDTLDCNATDAVYNALPVCCQYTRKNGTLGQKAKH